MKLFHLSDLHIGLKLIHRDLYEDQKYIFRQVVEYARAEQPDAVLIAGDVYDKAVPSAEAVELFDWFVTAITQAVPKAVIMMVSGNHDSAQRLNCYRGILSQQQVHMIGLPPAEDTEYMERVVLADAYGPVHFYLLPFVKPSMVKGIVGVDDAGNLRSYADSVARLFARESLDLSVRNVLVSHQFYLPDGANAEGLERMDSEVVTVGNIDAIPVGVLPPFDYVALGHIHKPMQVGASHIRYCGTPLACSVSEAGQQKGVVVAELGAKGDCAVRVLPLTPLRAVRVLTGTLEEVLAMPSEDYVTIVLTDPEDLDFVDMQDRIRAAFPNVLEIRRSVVQQSQYMPRAVASQTLSPYELCTAFLKELDDVSDALLRDVIHTVQGVR